MPDLTDTVAALLTAAGMGPPTACDPGVLLVPLPGADGCWVGWSDPAWGAVPAGTPTQVLDALHSLTPAFQVLRAAQTREGWDVRRASDAAGWPVVQVVRWPPHLDKAPPRDRILVDPPAVAYAPKVMWGGPDGDLWHPARR